MAPASGFRLGRCLLPFNPQSAIRNPQSAIDRRRTGDG
jgi:hypothetical protein